MSGTDEADGFGGSYVGSTNVVDASACSTSSGVTPATSDVGVRISPPPRSSITIVSPSADADFTLNVEPLVRRTISADAGRGASTPTRTTRVMPADFTRYFGSTKM